MQSMAVRFLALTLVVLSMTACKVGPDYVPPETKMPDLWYQELSAGLESGESAHQTWWVTFGDPILDGLIMRAGNGNLSLKNALSRIEQARALRGRAASGWYPQLDAIGDITRSKTSEGVLPGDLPIDGLGGTNTLYRAGFDAAWEIDVWGRIGRGVEATDASIEASVENYRDIMVGLFAEVAINYFELRALQERIQYARVNVKSQRGMVTLTQDRLDAEIAPELDVRQAELNLYTTEAVIPQFQADLLRTINRIGVLLGEEPGKLREELISPQQVPDPPEEVVVGLPANLLRQRPDIRRAERELAAQTALIGMETAEFYPKFTLFGSLTQESIGTSDFFDSGSTAWSLMPGIRWNIFSAGRIRANVNIAEARTEQALIAYEATVLLALEEVENALVGYQQERLRRDLLRKSVKAGEKSVELAETLYRTGVTDFQNVLDMQRSRAEQQDRLAQSEGLVVQYLVSLYKALGGGWKPDDPVSSSVAVSSEAP